MLTMLKLATLVATWSCAFLVGFHLETLRANRRVAAACSALGLAVIGLGVCGGLPASMVATSGSSISNMGDVTVSLLGLIAFQAGLVGLLGDRLVNVAACARIAKLVAYVNRNQAVIYVGHLPVWVLLALLFRRTSFGLPATANLHWLLLRPFWLILTVGGAALSARFLSAPPK